MTTNQNPNDMDRAHEAAEATVSADEQAWRQMEAIGKGTNINRGTKVSIRLNGVAELVPGIAVSNVFTEDRIRVNAQTGQERAIPTEYHIVLSFHTIPKGRSRFGEGYTYYQIRKQATNFLFPRSESVPALDGADKTPHVLMELVQKSRKELTARLEAESAARSRAEALWSNEPVLEAEPVQTNLPLTEELPDGLTAAEEAATNAINVTTTA